MRHHTFYKCILEGYGFNISDVSPPGELTDAVIYLDNGYHIQIGRQGFTLFLEGRSDILIEVFTTKEWDRFQAKLVPLRDFINT